jgi:hypothetical protein
VSKVKPTLDMDLGRHARKAAEIMRERGHTVGVAQNAAGQVCLMGAFRLAVSPMGWMNRAHLLDEFNARFGDWMAQHHPQAANFVVDWESNGVATMWNDCVLVTQEETLAWLDKYADATDPQR